MGFLEYSPSLTHGYGSGFSSRVGAGSCFFLKVKSGPTLPGSDTMPLYILIIYIIHIDFYIERKMLRVFLRVKIVSELGSFQRPKLNPVSSWKSNLDPGRLYPDPHSTLPWYIPIINQFYWLLYRKKKIKGEFYGRNWVGSSNTEAESGSRSTIPGSDTLPWYIPIIHILFTFISKENN